MKSLNVISLMVLGMMFSATQQVGAQDDGKSKRPVRQNRVEEGLAGATHSDREPEKDDWADIRLAEIQHELEDLKRGLPLKYILTEISA